MRLTRHVAWKRDERFVYKIWVRKLAGQELLVRPRCRWEVNIQVYHKGKKWESMNSAVSR
jgi:hypothetical protein